MTGYTARACSPWLSAGGALLLFAMHRQTGNPTVCSEAMAIEDLMGDVASPIVKALGALLRWGGAQRYLNEPILGPLGAVLPGAALALGAFLVLVGPPVVLSRVCKGGVTPGLLLIGWASVLAVLVGMAVQSPQVCYESAIPFGPPVEFSSQLPWWVPFPRNASAPAGWASGRSVSETLTPFETRGAELADGEDAPILRARTGWGSVWVARGVLSADALAPWSLQALLESEEADLEINAQVGYPEQHATRIKTLRLRDVILSGGRASGDTSEPNAYITEHTSTFQKSPRLAASAQAISDTVMGAGLGAARAARSPMMMTEYLWVGKAGVRSGLHVDPDPLNVLVQLTGEKDVWMFHPNDTAVLGTTDKWDNGAISGLTDPFTMWRAPGSEEASTDAFAEGDVCGGLNVVRSLGTGQASPLGECEARSAASRGGLLGATHVRLQAGDALLVPQGWMHFARSRTDGVSLSVRGLSVCEGVSVLPIVALKALHSVGLYQAGNCACHAE